MTAVSFVSFVIYSSVVISHLVAIVAVVVTDMWSVGQVICVADLVKSDGPAGSFKCT